MENTSIKTELEKRADMIIRKESTSYPGLSVIKYARNVFYDDLWDDFLEECRGMVLDDDFNIVSLPFRKIYNYGIEAKSPTFNPGEILDVYDKINGFMIAITYSPAKNDFIFSTTGSLDSDFIGYAKDMYNKHIHDKSTFENVLYENANLTFMFECVHPEDPHIVPEKEGLHFLGAREKTLFSPVKHPVLIPHITKDIVACGAHRVLHSTMLFETLWSKRDGCVHEGYVLYSGDGRASKIKSNFYLVKKAIMRSTYDKLVGKKGRFDIPEEFYPVFDEIEKIRDTFDSMTEMQKRDFIETTIKGIYK